MRLLGLPVVGLLTLLSIQDLVPDTVRECDQASLRQAAARLGGRRCFESAQGWFLTTDSVWASRASTSVREGATRFQQLFGEPVGRGVVLQIVDTSAGRSPNDSLKPLFPNAEWTWNWPVLLDPAQNAAEQLQAFGGLERHEMGHHWFTLWAKRHGLRDSLPYWMMETPAILMEDSAATVRRYQNLNMLPTLGASRIPLAELFTMENPAVRVVGRANFDPQDIWRGELFYDECRALADFLVARTGDPSVIGALASSVIHGETMAQWLQAHGAQYKLPATVEALEQAWQAWLP